MADRLGHGLQTLLGLHNILMREEAMVATIAMLLLPSAGIVGVAAAGYAQSYD